MVSFVDLAVFKGDENCLVRITTKGYDCIPEDFLWREIESMKTDYAHPNGPIYTDVSDGETRMCSTLAECKSPSKKIMWLMAPPFAHFLVGTADYKDSDEKVVKELKNLAKNFEKKKTGDFAQYEDILVKACIKPATSNVLTGLMKF